MDHGFHSFHIFIHITQPLWIPSGNLIYVYIAIEHDPVEIVDLPIKHDDVP